MPVLAPQTIPLNVPLSNPLMNPLSITTPTGVVNPQLITQVSVQGVINPTALPNVLGLLLGMGIMERVKIKRKMKAMRVSTGAPKTD